MQSASEAARRSRGLLRGLRLALAAFLLLGDARLLAAQSAQVIELGAAHLAAAHDLDRVDHRRIEREHALDALAVGNLAHREALVDAAAGARDAQTLISLQTRALALDDLHVHDEGVAGRKVRNFLAGSELFDLLLLDLFQQVHGFSPAAAPRAGRSGGRGQMDWAGFYWKETALSPSPPSFRDGPKGPGPESITTSRDYGF